MLDRSLEPSAQQIARRAVRDAKRALRSQRAPRADIAFDHIFWFGAVDINPKHCAVWLIFKGSDQKLIPRWLMPLLDAESQQRARASLTPEDCRWLADLAESVVQKFRARGWEWTTPHIGAESLDRVTDGGGFFYFK